MDWDQKQNPLSSSPTSSEDHNGGGGGGGGMFVKVMTDEQMKVLRKQIAVYATICEQLVELHKSLTAHTDLATGVRLGNIYCDPLISSAAAHKISGRQRWNPTPTQLQILERMFDQGIGTPSKQKIKEITLELSHHGQISETNVYNWFQNRRARSKRKQQTAQSNNNNSNNGESSEVETEVESPGQDKKTKLDEGFLLQQQMLLSLSRKRDGVASFLNQHIGDDSIFGGDFGQMALYGSMLQNPRTDHLIAKVEVDGSYTSYTQQPNHGDFNIS